MSPFVCMLPPAAKSPLAQAMRPGRRLLIVICKHNLDGADREIGVKMSKVLWIAGDYEALVQAGRQYD